MGALWAKNKIDSYTESDGTIVADSSTRVTTLSVAGDLAYSFQEYEPFVGLSYQYDQSSVNRAYCTKNIRKSPG
ncbi:MAG: hypothetical protein O7D86_06430 [Proteobacteria bacterium]|nr:hypothetical protein [Pseudomonadota bacterium]